MIFGKYINKYYIKYAPILLLGVLALIAVDYLQLLVPEIYRTVVNGVNDGAVTDASGTVSAFDLDFLLDKVCLPLIGIIVSIIEKRVVDVCGAAGMDLIIVKPEIILVDIHHVISVKLRHNMFLHVQHSDNYRYSLPY